MENKKMTKRDYFNALLNVEEVKANSAMVTFIEHELELLSKKNASDRKPTATQKENEAIKAGDVPEGAQRRRGGFRHRLGRRPHEDHHGPVRSELGDGEAGLGYSRERAGARLCLRAPGH